MDYRTRLYALMSVGNRRHKRVEQFGSHRLYALMSVGNRLLYSNDLMCWGNARIGVRLGGGEIPTFAKLNSIYEMSGT